MSLLFVLFPVSGVYRLLLLGILLSSLFLANVEEAALLPQELPRHSEECLASQSLGTYSMTKCNIAKTGLQGVVSVLIKFEYVLILPEVFY